VRLHCFQSTWQFCLVELGCFVDRGKAGMDPLDVYPDGTSRSQHSLYDCETVRSPVSKTIFTCSQDKTKTEVSISAPNVAYELWIHSDKEPGSVALDSRNWSG
jgi:hypothetical protein